MEKEDKERLLDGVLRYATFREYLKEQRKKERQEIAFRIFIRKIAGKEEKNGQRQDD